MAPGNTVAVASPKASCAVPYNAVLRGYTSLQLQAWHSCCMLQQGMQRDSHDLLGQLLSSSHIPDAKNHLGTMLCRTPVQDTQFSTHTSVDDGGDNDGSDAAASCCEQVPATCHMLTPYPAAIWFPWPATPCPTGAY